MWALVWIHFLHGKLEYYHIGTFETEEACYAEQVEAKVLKKHENSGVVCLYIAVQ
jgi:hypothetical protein